jgi:hypothetical protein
MDRSKESRSVNVRGKGVVSVINASYIKFIVVFEVAR